VGVRGSWRRDLPLNMFCGIALQNLDRNAAYALSPAEGTCDCYEQVTLGIVDARNHRVENGGALPGIVDIDPGPRQQEKACINDNIAVSNELVFLGRAEGHTMRRSLS
jgi:hypothetical protein